MTDPDASPEEDGLRIIQQQLGNFTDGQIETIMGLFIAEHKDRRRRATTAAALALRPGDVVENLKPGRRLPAGVRGKVERDRSPSVLVCFHQFGKWEMDATLVAKVESDGARRTQRPEAKIHGP